MENFVSKMVLVINNLLLVLASAYLGGLLWYRCSDYILPKFFVQQEPAERYFVIHFGLRRPECEADLGDQLTIRDRIIYCMYFMLTTLSTVGYGDYYPYSMSEKIFGCIL
jgi:hypothetical protein